MARCKSLRCRGSVSGNTGDDVNVLEMVLLSDARERKRVQGKGGLGWGGVGAASYSLCDSSFGSRPSVVGFVGIGAYRYPSSPRQLLRIRGYNRDTMHDSKLNSGRFCELVAILEWIYHLKAFE